MASPKFLVKSHRFEGQHLRHYPGATRNGDTDIQYLEAKQYIPRSGGPSKASDITIIGAHAVSFPKELYEPLWEELLDYLEQRGVGIRSIWIADASHVAGSYVLNERTIADDPSHSDYARDVLQMTNVFRADMIQPIVGVGHSMGGTSLIELGCIHPRLFASLVLIDPLIGRDSMLTGARLIHMAAVKPDLFPSRDVAEKQFKKPFKHWDERTFRLWMKYGLRDTPTVLYPEAGKVTLSTTKANESWSYVRPRFTEPSDHDIMKYPDAPEDLHTFYRAESDLAYISLPRLSADVFYLFPDGSNINEEAQDRMLARTGTALGGCGGIKHERVAKAIVKGAGHLCPFEKPRECADAIASWLDRDLQAWQQRRDFERTHRDDKSIDRIRLSKEWIRRASEFSKTKTVPPLKL